MFGDIGRVLSIAEAPSAASAHIKTTLSCKQIPISLFRAGSAHLWSGASVRHPKHMPCSRLSIDGHGGMERGFRFACCLAGMATG